MLATSKSISGFDPRSIVGCSLWLDGADPAGTGVVPANGASISSWMDKSGNRYNATVYSGRTAATWSAASNCVYFQASTVGYQTSYPANPSTETMFIVANIDSPADGNNNAIICGGSGARSFGFGYSGSGGTGRSGSGYLNSRVAWASTWIAGPSAGTTALVTGTVITTSSIACGLNGSDLTAGTVSAFSSSAGTTLGVDTTYTPIYFKGYVMDIIFYSRVLGTTERRSVEGYLAWKWGIKSSLPAIHPFYSTPAFSRPFGPTDIPGCALWLDGADSSTASMTFSSGSNLSVWKDKSGAGNNFNLTAGTTSNISDGGYSVVNFPSGAIMSSANRITFTTSSAFFIVSKVTNTTYFCYLLGFSDLISGDFGIKYLYGILTGTPGSTQSSGAGELGSTTFYVNGSFNPNFGSNYYTNVYAIIDTVAPVSGGTSYLTLSSAFYSRYFIGNIAEFLFYPGGVTSSQRQQIEGYLAAKWGLLNNLPGKTLSPMNIPGCVLWLDGADQSTITGTTTMTAWKDKSPNRYTANSFSNSVAAPSWVSNVQNGNGVIQYSAGNGSSISSFVLAQTMSIFEVYYPINQAIDGPFLEQGTNANAGSSAGFFFHAQNNNNFLINPAGPTATSVNFGTTAISNTWQLIEGINPDPASSTTMAYYVNGVVKASGTTQSGTTTVTATLYINGRGGANVLSYNAYLAELIIYNTALSTAQRQSVENYLMSKWGISNVTSHPFKSIPPSTSQPPQFQEVTPGNWTRDWQPYLQRLAAANSSGVTVTTSNIAGAATYTDYGWNGGVLAPNGNIYFAPLNALNILVYNPTTGTTSNLTGGATYVANGWTGGVLASNGNIYFTPKGANSSANILVLNPTTGVTSNFTGGATYVGNGWGGGVLAPNGNIYCAPLYASNVLVINPTTGVTSNLTGGATYTASGYYGGVLAPNGNIYFAPWNATSIFVVNPTTGVTSNLTGGATYTGNGKWFGGVLAPNGNIYFCPTSATNILVLNPTTGVTSNLTGGASYASGGWFGGVLAPNGNIYFCPASATNILVLNPTTGVTSNLTGGATYTAGLGEAWAGGVLGLDGNIYCTPDLAKNVLKINFAGLSQTPSSNYCLSAWTNKR